MMLVAVCCYNRPQNIEYWLRAWRNMDKSNVRLCFVTTGKHGPSKRTTSEYMTMKLSNQGMDIGALKQLIDVLPDTYDRIFWTPDDFMPLRKDLFSLYKTADLVGTFWSAEKCLHMRSGGFCMTRELAKSLVFPKKLLIPDVKIDQVKDACYEFELGSYGVKIRNFNAPLNTNAVKCFYQQAVDGNFTVKMVDGTTPPNSPHWLTTPQQYMVDSGYLIDSTRVGVGKFSEFIGEPVSDRRVNRMLRKLRIRYR